MHPKESTKHRELQGCLPLNWFWKYPYNYGDFFPLDC